MANCKQCGKKVYGYIKHEGITWNVRKITAVKKIQYNILWDKRWKLEIAYKGNLHDCWYLDTIESHHKFECADEISCDQLLRLFSSIYSRE